MRRPLRIGFYCHNTFGLGHIMRSTRIATAVRQADPDADIRIITGCRALSKIRFPERVAIKELEPLDPDAFARQAAAPQILNRSREISDFVRHWEPDVLLVDLLPTGLCGELLPTLNFLEAEHLPTHLVLGLPYAERQPMTRSKWSNKKLAIDHYRTVLAYSDPAFSPVLDDYREFIRDADQIYTGIVAARPIDHATRCSTDKPLVVVLNGGGGTAGIFHETRRVLEDGLRHNSFTVRLVGGVLSAWKEAWPPGMSAGFELVEAMTAEDAVRGATTVITRCGYNTAFSVLRSSLPIVFVPEPRADQEQLIRARQLTKYDRIWCVDPGMPESDRELSAALNAALKAPVTPRDLPIDFGGAGRTAEILRALARRVADL